ncbi:hypothetical protein HPB50_016377 [Hyalomma asiaticum]|uniref:Uncharacterized protein n=1 Tax=Hyalomma asiaticum TaxID=266040 RepID=A0ACB7RSJ2_HYAAI|nr:hypothetical protein HPB50_016377 [Hyalomma asiaticum]
MELNLMLAQERRRQLQLLIELAKLKQAKASRAELVGKVIGCRADSEPAANSLAAGKAAVPPGVLRTEREFAASSEPEKQIQGMLLAAQVAGHGEVPCSDVVAGNSPDIPPLCSQDMEAETQATLTATRTAGLETELGSDLIVGANAREDPASLRPYQDASNLQESCKGFNTLSNNGCGEPVDTVVATPVAVAWELPDSNKEPRGELAQIGSSVATEVEASADMLEARTLRRGLSETHCRENSPHTFEAHPLQSNFCWRRPAEEMGGPSRVSTATELTVGARSILSMGDKPPGSIKEVVKTMAEMTAKFAEVLSELKTEMKNIDRSNNSIKAELKSVVASMGFINSNFEEFKEEIASLRQELSQVQKQNLVCQTANKRMDKELKETRRQLTELKQYSRRSNLELKGIPCTENEVLVETMQKIAKFLMVDLVEGDIDAIHRVRTRGDGPANVIVRFNSRRKRDLILQAARKKRPTTAMLGSENAQPLYVNEHLCPEYKVLLGKAIQMKREKKWKFVWVSEGKVLMRKADNSRVISLTTFMTLWIASKGQDSVDAGEDPARAFDWRRGGRLNIPSPSTTATRHGWFKADLDKASAAAYHPSRLMGEPPTALTEIDIGTE